MEVFTLDQILNLFLTYEKHLEQLFTQALWLMHWASQNIYNWAYGLLLPLVWTVHIYSDKCVEDRILTQFVCLQPR